MTNKVPINAKIKGHKVITDLDGYQRHIFLEDYGPNVYTDWREYDMSDIPMAKGFGRWIYCKYCYQSVTPKTNYDGSLIVCPLCYAGLIPLYERKFHLSEESYQEWRNKYSTRHPDIPV